MTTPEYVTLPDFTVFIDRAGHAIAERVNGKGATDFGFRTPAANVINAFIDGDRDALAPAVNAYLLGLTAKCEESEIDRRVRNAIEDADGLEIRPEHNVTRDQLRRFGVTQTLSGFRISELSAALTVRETAAERGRLGRSLRKDDLVQLLVVKYLGNRN